jgi:hypothetical protein
MKSFDDNPSKSINDTAPLHYKFDPNKSDSIANN